MQSATFSKVEPMYIDGDGKQHTYVPHTITTARHAYAASLHLVFNHIAEFHSVMVRIISEKYGIPEEHIFETVRSDPRFSSLIAEPVVQSMGYFEEDDLSAALQKMKVTDTPMEDAAAASGAPPPPKKKLMRRSKKPAATAEPPKDADL